jgi:molybdopterin adenylyltransferase
MSSDGQIVAVNISEAKGTTKHSVDEITIDARGICGDAHAGAWHRQVSMLAQESIDVFAQDAGRAVAPGEFAENLTVCGVDLAGVAILDRFRIGDVELEVSQIGKKCHGAGCAIFQEVGTCVMPKEGIFCRVINGGRVRPGDALEFLPRALRILVVTLSDRAAAGEYEDRSGPRVCELLGEFFSGKRWHLELQTALLPDDADRLQSVLSAAIEDGVDAIFTLGGTGIGPRDISPETVAGLCQKMMPGIMEGIRTKFGAEHPAALLSRSVAGIAGRTQLYALPGSVRAVEEYTGEILKTFEHALYMLHGLDVH